VIDPNLEPIVVEIRLTEEANGEALRSAGGRTWLDWTGVEGFSGDKAVGRFDYERLHELFDRSAANKDYLVQRADINAQTMNVQTSKLSVDFLAACERDWRMRTRSRVRMFAHAAARHRAHGLPAGPLTVHSVGWLSVQLKEQKVTI